MKTLVRICVNNSSTYLCGRTAGQQYLFSGRYLLPRLVRRPATPESPKTTLHGNGCWLPLGGSAAAAATCSCGPAGLESGKVPAEGATWPVPPEAASKLKGDASKLGALGAVEPSSAAAACSSSSSSCPLGGEGAAASEAIDEESELSSELCLVRRCRRRRDGAGTGAPSPSCWEEARRRDDRFTVGEAGAKLWPLTLRNQNGGPRREEVTACKAGHVNYVNVHLCTTALISSEAPPV